MNAAQNSKDTILQCALEQFSQRGYDSVSVSEIVESAGITKPTLYYFFGSKEGVFQTVLEAGFSRLLGTLAESSAYEPRREDYFNDVYPVLIRTARAYFDFARRNPLFYTLMLALSFSPPTAKQTQVAAPFRAAHKRVIADMFHAFSLEHGNLAGKEELLARKFTAAVNEEIMFRLTVSPQGDKDAEKADYSDVIAQLVHTFMHGIFA